MGLSAHSNGNGEFALVKSALECEQKKVWMRLLEWLVLYLVVGGLGYLLEQRLMGTTHVQDWEFYAVTASLFMVFAFPGFVYRHIR